MLIGQGYGIDGVVQIPWLQHTSCLYWGDLDTHGFAILNRARSYLPDLKSLLMDTETLLCYPSLWVTEKDQHAAPELPLLTPSEHEVYQGLKQQRWGSNVRLEQERIPWDDAWQWVNIRKILRPIIRN